MTSNISALSDITIDPTLRRKAEKIIKDNPSNNLEIIKEENNIDNE